MSITVEDFAELKREMAEAKKRMNSLEEALAELKASNAHLQGLVSQVTYWTLLLKNYMHTHQAKSNSRSMGTIADDNNQDHVKQWRRMRPTKNECAVQKTDSNEQWRILISQRDANCIIRDRFASFKGGIQLLLIFRCRYRICLPLNLH